MPKQQAVMLKQQRCMCDSLTISQARFVLSSHFMAIFQNYESGGRPIGLGKMP